MAKTEALGIEYLASLAKLAVLPQKRVYFTEFTDFSTKINRGLLEDSVISSKTGKFSNSMRSDTPPWTSRRVGSE